MNDSSRPKQSVGFEESPQKATEKEITGEF